MEMDISETSILETSKPVKIIMTVSKDCVLTTCTPRRLWVSALILTWRRFPSPGYSQVVFCKTFQKRFTTEETKVQMKAFGPGEATWLCWCDVITNFPFPLSLHWIMEKNEIASAQKRLAAGSAILFFSIIQWKDNGNGYYLKRLLLKRLLRQLPWSWQFQKIVFWPRVHHVITGFWRWIWNKQDFYHPDVCQLWFLDVSKTVGRARKTKFKWEHMDLVRTRVELFVDVITNFLFYCPLNG